MPRKDLTFTGRDCARIYFNNLDLSEQREAKALICTDTRVEDLEAAAKVFKLLKFGPGAFKALGVGGSFLFTSAAKILKLVEEGKLDSLRGGTIGFLIPDVKPIPIPSDLRLKRLPLSGGR